MNVETFDGGVCRSDRRKRDCKLLKDGFSGLYCPVNKCVVVDGNIIGHRSSLEEAKKLFLVYLTTSPIEFKNMLRKFI